MSRIGIEMIECKLNFAQVVGACAQVPGNMRHWGDSERSVGDAISHAGGTELATY